MGIKNMRIEFEIEPGNIFIDSGRCVVYVQEEDDEWRPLLGVQLAELMVSKNESYFYMEKYPDSELIVTEEQVIDEPIKE